MSDQLIKLYKDSWIELNRLRKDFNYILEQECTPVLHFGNIKDAKVITAGLNPSEVEFRENGVPLVGNKRRFLHYSESNNGEINADHIDEAFLRSENYFNKNPYQKWFNKYDSFLEGLECSFKNGSACHTDYYSPFATVKGLSEIDSNISSQQLLKFGLLTWKEILECAPNVEVIFGHGQGHNHMGKLFNFDKWEIVQLPFEKNIRQKDPFLKKDIIINNSRRITLFWWKPNLNGHGLSILTNEEKRILGKYILENCKF